MIIPKICVSHIFENKGKNFLVTTAFFRKVVLLTKHVDGSPYEELVSNTIVKQSEGLTRAIARETGICISTKDIAIL